MNARSLSLYKYKAMKTLLLIKYMFLVPLVLFIDYVVMAFLGCASCLVGTEKYFNCNVFYNTGKTILTVSALLFIYLIIRDSQQYKRHLA